MWMMGYNDGADFNNIPDSFNGRKLRPLIPRPLPSPNSPPSHPPPPCLTRIHHGSDFFAQYHHLAVAEQSKKDHQLNNPQVVVSSRWNPTPEQLRALEELYRRGTRTPSADQIQHITAQLRKYGKIEGKNVFYWFQNHKARERQKRRRQMESAIASAADDIQILSSENKKDQLGASRTVFEVEQTKNWAPSKNCSALAEESAVSILQRTAKAAAAADQCRTDGWIQFDEEEFQQTRNFVEKNATWQMMHLSCPSPPLTAAPTHHLINSTPTSTSCSTCTTTTTTCRATVTSAMDQKQLIKSVTHHNDLSIFIAPYRSVETGQLINHQNQNTNGLQDQEESQTLQLFPLRSGDYGNESNVHHENGTQLLSAGSAMSANFSTTPNYHFFEFLPVKN